MPAVPYRAELVARAIGAGASIALAFLLAGGMIAAVGRHGDLNLGWVTAALLPLAVLAAVALYTTRRRRLQEQLIRPRVLPADAERAAPPHVAWRGALVRGVLGGLAFGALALMLDVEVDILAIVLAIAIGGVLGEDAANAWIVGRYEREHGGTVYGVADGLAWAPA